MKQTHLLTLLTAAMLGGCAHLPDATVGYYLPTSDVSFKVMRTIACDGAGNPIIATAVTPTVRHYANKTGANALKTVSLARLKGDLSDSDVKFDFYEDGRLAGINASTTGQGEAILKTAISLVSTVVKTGGFGILTLTPNRCQQIKDFGGGKPLTVTYSGSVSLTDAATTDIMPDADSAFYADTFKDVLRPITATVEGHSVPDAPVAFAAGIKDVILTARQPGTVRIKMRIAGVDKPVWNDELVVAAFGTDYSLPIPRPVAFGKKTLAVSFAESGAIKSIQYVSNTGAGQTLNVANAGLTALQGDTTAQKAADIKAEADLIQQQQRLVTCKADPATCK